MAKAKKPIFTVGFGLPGDDFEHVSFDSVQTLLDADIILIEPGLGDPSFGYNDFYNGVAILDHTCGVETNNALSHWRSEIVSAVNAGRLVVVFVRKPLEFYRYTGDKTFSGTGRSRVTTNIVGQISSYGAIPKLKRITPKRGSDVALSKDAKFLADYWKQFGKVSEYEAEIEVDEGVLPTLTVAGQRTVGAVFRGKQGTLLFLPPLKLEGEDFETEKVVDGQSQLFWTDQADEVGARLAAVLREVAKSLSSGDVSPPPAWAMSSHFQTQVEADAERAIAEATAKIECLQQERLVEETRLADAGTLRHLLYEQGGRLENAVLEAMTLLGFKAQRFAEGDSEFDAVLDSPEGRCIGEAEGKDNKAINIEKFAQLERNLQEDFARDEVSAFAKGVLFGNAQRLLPIDQRGDFFTAKCLSAAQRVGAALVRTPDLFVVARYLRENPNDSAFAEACRVSIFAAGGKIVSFPSAPSLATVGPSKEASTAAQSAA